jgi:hypothetical protein
MDDHLSGVPAGLCADANRCEKEAREQVRKAGPESQVKIVLVFFWCCRKIDGCKLLKMVGAAGLEPATLSLEG